MPFTLIVPLEGFSSAVSILKVVDLPAPFSPSKMNLSFLLKLKETDSTAFNVLFYFILKDFEIFETESNSGLLLIRFWTLYYSSTTALSSMPENYSSS